MNKEEFIQLLDKYIAGNASHEEEQMLHSYYRYFQEHGVVDEAVLNKMNKDGTEMWLNISSRIGETKHATIRKMPAWNRYAVAASVLLIMGVGGYFWTINTDKPDNIISANQKTTNNDLLPGGQRAILQLADGSVIELDSAKNGAIALQGQVEVVKLQNGQIMYRPNAKEGGAVINTMSTPKGGKYELVLPDGSKVWLNAASSITYPTAFTGLERQVKITGEVYFEVAKNKTKPFIVKTGSDEITVLGTSFNVNAYLDEDVVKTTLVEGAVKVGDKLLQPGQAYVQGKIIETNIDRDVAWKNGFFQFDNADLKTVMRQLARWYDVEIIYEGSVPDYRFGGEIPMDALASQVLNVLKKNKVNFRIEGRKIIVGAG